MNGISTPEEKRKGRARDKKEKKKDAAGNKGNERRPRERKDKGMALEL